MYISKRLVKIDINIVNINTTHVLVQVYQYRVTRYLLQLHDIYYRARGRALRENTLQKLPLGKMPLGKYLKHRLGEEWGYRRS